MLSRPRILHNVLTLVISLLLVSPATLASADENPFDCHVEFNGRKWDLTKLAGEHIALRTRSSPPSSMVDKLRFDLCDDLKELDDIDAHDQCVTGTRACITTFNKKHNEKDRIVAVVPLAQTLLLKPKVADFPSGLSILFHGPLYPHSSSSELTEQAINFTLICDGETKSDPDFVSYDGSTANVKWTVPEACPTNRDNPDKGDKDNGGDGSPENVGSGVGWFFLVIFFSFLAYFGIGAYHNYTTYGARGMDLIPHRDFWKDVPYMLRDVVSHLCSAVRPRQSSSRGGYIAV